MGKYKLINNVLGWIVFAIASTVYLMTIEPTASFWDCGEFISSAYKLEVGHPPGAPFFMLTANLFTQLASDSATVAKMVNTMSALFSGLTILFLFWSITHLARKIMVKDGEEASLGQMITIMGSGLVGALAYTFSDTFWFSAVEGEVYAYSSLFTAVVFWLILKWEAVADKPHADRWIVLIAYLMGLSIGVHLLNLLCIPAIVLVYYYKKFPNPTMKGTLVALLVSFAIVALMMYGVVQGLVEVCGYFELLFVNVLGMPYNSGVFAYVIIVASVLIWAIHETMRDEIRLTRMKIAFILSVVLIGIPFIGSGYVLAVILTAALSLYLFKSKKADIKTLNTILVCLMVVVVGYSSYALTLIRATADTPMNQNAPSDIFTLRTYLAREQYGKTPLLYGQTYVSEVQRENQGGSCVPVTTEGEPTWSRVIKKDKNEKDRYYVSRTDQEYKYVDELNMLFPRMHSSDPRHVQAYKDWAQVKGQPVKYNYCGEMKSVMKPTFAENLKFFFSYQLNFMYWRYFMWNFVGRQSDIQPSRELIVDGNWLSGIGWIDRMYVGPQDELPREVAENRGRNTYYFLPFLLGLIGLFYQLNRDPRNFSIVMWLFVMTGIALVVYFNSSPSEPRERDYVYAGSFYAFSIWIGLGVLAVRDLLARLFRRDDRIVAAAATLLCMGVPAVLAAENWDDHDRSHRYMARDIGWNYLQSTLPNSIILNYGDNDTFPLWNNQEVYGVRPDVRIMNTSYLGGEWYIDEMKTRANEAEGVPFSLPKSKYTFVNDWLPVSDKVGRVVELKDVIDFVRSEDPRTKIKLSDGSKIDYIPAKRIALPVDKENAIAAGIVREEDRDLMVDTVYLNLSKGSIDKSELMILDMLAHFDWKRPIYLTQVYILQNLGLLDYLQFDGYAYRFVPILTPVRSAWEIGRIDPDYTAPLLRGEGERGFRYGNLADPRVYVDHFLQYNLSASRSREAFARVAKELLRRDRAEEAVELLDLGLQRLPISQIRFTDANTYPFLEAYYAAAMGAEGAAEKGDALMRAYTRNLIEYIDYYLRFDGVQAELVDPLLDEKLDQLSEAYYLAGYAGRKEILAELNAFYRTLGIEEEHLMDAGDKPLQGDTTLLSQLE